MNLLWLLYFIAIIAIIVIILPIDVIVIIVIIDIIVIIAYCWQVRADLGLPDHVWVEKRAAIAKQVDDLGDQFRPAMRKGWLDYIQKTYVADADDYVAAIGQGDLVVPDDDWLLWGPVLVCALNTYPNCSFVVPNNSNNSSNNSNNCQ